MAKEEKYLYGPVPSRRLGRSLGVDIVPFKVCTFDCVYCQLGRTTQKTLERKDYIPVDAVLSELKDKLAGVIEADYITISGSGEPTLHSKLGELIDGIKKITEIPVAVITNGTLLYRQDVRADCARADVVLPSLDAGDEQTFQKINRPHPDLSSQKLTDGLSAFRDEFPGRLWLEVFLIEGFNTDKAQIEKIMNAVKRIRPDKIQLNTAVRPAAEPNVKKVDTAKMQAIARQFGHTCEVVADASPSRRATHVQLKQQYESAAIPERYAEILLSMLKRRPCSLEDICIGLGMHRNQALKYVNTLQQQGLIDFEHRHGTVFFKAN